MLSTCRESAPFRRLTLSILTLSIPNHPPVKISSYVFPFPPPAPLPSAPLSTQEGEAGDAFRRAAKFGDRAPPRGRDLRPCCGVACDPQHDLVPHIGPAATPISLIRGFISVSVTAQPAQAGGGGAWVFLPVAQNNLCSTCEW